jgi:peptidoglycan/LPS O-acetylase OafA/YrhL
MKQWFPEIDILKAVAILLIVFGHIDRYVSNYDLVRMAVFISPKIVLGLFFFISGFLLSQNDSVVHSTNDLKKFYVKKFIRIYPLYWIALATFVICFGLLQINPGHISSLSSYDFSLNTLLLQFLGLQGIFPTNIEQPLWFVGVIILFYLLYKIIIYLSKNFFETFIVSSIILIFLAILYFFFGLIDINVLTYYPIFISGIFINQMVYFSKKIFDENFLKQILFSSLILIFVIFLFFLLRKFYDLTLQFNPILEIIGVINLCIFCLIFTHLFIKIRGKIMVLLSSIAFATYAIYLFHLQFLAVFSLTIDSIIQNIILQDIIILTFGFAGAILCGIVIQKIEQYFIRICIPRLQLIGSEIRRWIGKQHDTF